MGRRAKQDCSEQTLNPVALSLAVWLGLLTGITGLSRMPYKPPTPGPSAARLSVPDNTDGFQVALAARQ